MKNGRKLILAALLLAGCSGSKLLPHETSASTAGFQNFEQVEAAYSAITPGRTTTADLSKLGFDLKLTPNIEVLNYVGVLDRLPRDARSAGQIPPQVQACIQSQDRCIAYVFHPEHFESRQFGNTFLELGGFEHKTISAGWSAEVVLLIQDGLVVHKIMSGHPRIEDTHTSTQPLGPLQNLGSAATGSQPEKNE